jgi:hypothetical protein
VLSTLCSIKDIDLAALEKQLGAKDEAGMRTIIVAMQKEAVHRHRWPFQCRYPSVCLWSLPAHLAAHCSPVARLNIAHNACCRGVTPVSLLVLETS